MLNNKWSWQEEVETFIAKLVRGYCVHLCSGRSDIGDIRVDLYTTTNCNWVEDIADLSLPSEFADTVICDPVYLTGHIKHEEIALYQSIRILKPGGRLIWYHVKVPQAPALQLEDIFLYPNKHTPVYRILSVHKKVNSILKADS